MDKLKEFEDLGYLHDIFKRQCQLTPTKLAVVFAETEITFAELDRKTDILAQKLISNGARKDGVVGIYMRKCLEYVIAYISILKSGAAYMPLDVTYPINLLKDIFMDANPSSVITNTSWNGDLQDIILENQNIVNLTGDWEKDMKSEFKEPAGDCILQQAELNDLAYVCYSSGTTGKPKGIMCPHRGSVFSYTWRHLAYPFAENERVACNIFFVWELLRPLLKGIPMYIIPDEVIYDPVLLSKFVKKHSITRIVVTPSLLETVINTDGVDLNDFSSLRIIWFTGEVVTMSLLGRCVESFPSARLLNYYNATECHDVAAADLSQYWIDIKEQTSDVEALAKRKFAPVGKVLPGVHIYILDEELNIQPTGVTGEIYVGGPTLARGYLNRPKLNAERFIDLPQNGSTTRVYRSGDWGLMLPNKILEICGRCDTMVKIRGYSVETQAVEAALLQISVVNACVVVTKGEEGDDKQLVAYIVPQTGANKKQIRTELKNKLPAYMIPSYFVFLKKIPMVAATGKLNKKALPSVFDKTSTPESCEKTMEGDDDESDLPKTETENSLAQIWSDILQFRVTDIEESFFDLGGHSLLAARLLGKIRELYDVDIDVQTLFSHPTVAELSRVIDSKNAGHDIGIQPKNIDLSNEVKLNMIPSANLDIQLRAFWRSANYSYRWKRGRVLLTGATGFLGAYLLKDLLIDTKAQIYCLVRKGREEDNAERLRNTFKFYELFNNESDKLKQDFDARVHTISGDVALLDLGMGEEDYAHLSFEIDYVIHAAAFVNLLYPYEAFKGANVHGTRNVLMFCKTGKIKALHYISTNSVLPNYQENCKETSSAFVKSELEDGYSQSKWVAEQLVMHAIESGLPATIYRPGNVSGDRVNAGWNSSDFNLLVIRASILTGVWPDINWSVEMTPVDFLSNAIVQLSQNFSIAMHKVFHLVNPKAIDSSVLFFMICAAGYELQMVKFDDWCDAVEGMDEKLVAPGTPSPRSMLGPITQSKDTSLFSFVTTYDNAVFNKVMKTLLKQEYPTLNQNLIDHYLKNLSRRKLIPPPKPRHGRDLHGKVALVTGASSGIGEAVAKYLAQAGAKVCIAARRVDKLEEIKKEIIVDGGISESFSLDVTDRKQFKKIVKTIEDKLGSVDILVNNAGLMYYTHMHNLMMDDWDEMISVNCRGVSNGIGAVLPGMLKKCSGHIVNTSSDAGRRGLAGLAVYSGTKFFVEGLSQGLRQEIKGKGIRVTCIQPGDVKTELLTHTKDHEAMNAYDESESCEILNPNDVGRAVLYAVTQPDHVGVNEILIEPRENPI
ncbi:uncharacterized protein LOC120348546 [Styela clava]